MPLAHRNDDDYRARWDIHRLEEPTFSDFTRGVLLGVSWCFLLWLPMFLDVLANH